MIYIYFHYYSNKEAETTLKELERDTPKICIEKNRKNSLLCSGDHGKDSLL
jgi:hypothetical protein